MLDAGTHIGAVTLKVALAEILRVERFYTDVLGLQAMERADGRLTFGAGANALVHLETIKDATRPPKRTTGLYHFALLTPNRKALGQALHRLVRTGYPLQGAADHLVSEALYLADPEGNGIEIYRDRPRSEWTFDGPSVMMANEPVDLESLLNEAGSEQPPSMDEGTTMGHIHLHVRDLKEAEQFYCETLGFTVMARWGPSALFVAAGGYHHHIGLNTWAGVGTPPPPEGSTGLKHFEIVVPNGLEDVVGRLQAVEEVAGGFLTHDPSGNGILLRQS